MEKVEGFRYVVNHSINPQAEPYAGMAELYFHDATGWAKFQEVIKPDGMEEWMDQDGALMLIGTTELVGLQ